MKRFLFLSTLLILVTSCGEPKIDTTKARQEMEDREIKLVSDAEIVERAMEMGMDIAKDFTLEVISEPLSETYVINTEFGPDSLYQKHRYFFDEPTDLSGKSLQVFEAYLYNRDKGIESEPNLQKINNGVMLYYTTPMYADSVVVGMWAIEIPRKNVVLSIKN